MLRLLLPLALAALLTTGPVRADCELLYAPPEIRARLLAFHHANELRRARERLDHRAASNETQPPVLPIDPARATRHYAVPAKPPDKSG